MKRAKHLWPGVVSFDALCRAAHRAAAGKRRVAAVARFLADLEPEVLSLQRELEADAWRPGPTSSFEVLDPKRRWITAAPFRDRVVHHALMGVLEPVLDRRMVAESFACRKGKGTHAALRHARRMVRRHEWFLALDIEQCFASMSPDVVLATLGRCVKDRHVLRLAERIVRTGVGSHGLPIGSLTSQWLANLVLDRLDHFVKERLRVPGYVRYMDDFVLFAQAKSVLAWNLLEVRAFLAQELDLRLKERAVLLAPVRQGLPFLGWRVYRGVSRLRPENVRRTKHKLRMRVRSHQRGEIEAAQLVSSVRSVCEHLSHGGTRAMRREWLDRGAVFGKLEEGTR